MPHFTEQQVEEMRQRLATKAVKDTDLPETEEVSMGDYVAIVQAGENKKVTIATLYSEVRFEEYTIRIYVYNGGNILINGQSADLIAFVYRNAIDITSRIPQSLFSWERSSKNHEQDEVWNSMHRGVGNNIHITSEEVNRTCTFFCVVPTNELRRIIINN